jgi:hypothetical protein
MKSEDVDANLQAMMMAGGYFFKHGRPPPAPPVSPHACAHRSRALPQILGGTSAGAST